MKISDALKNLAVAVAGSGEAAAGQGESTTAFINRAIDETMERDNAAPGAAGGATEGEIAGPSD